MKLTLLSTALLLAGCNEKVSPELQDAASSATVPPTVAPSEYYFKLENTASPLLNYKLHKTGAGNYNSDCSISKNVPLTNSLYSVDADSDISCFMDTEELALYISGLSFKVSASPNTCEYVAYEPFSYYNRIPGNSSTRLYKFTCDAASIDSTDIIDGTDGSDDNDITITESLATTGLVIGCGRFLDRTIPAADRGAFTVTTDEELCRFNYQNGDEEKCDEGEILVTEITLTKDDNADVSATSSSRLIKCGGKAINCVRGPITKHNVQAANWLIFQGTQLGTAYEGKYEYEGLIETHFPGTFEYANYRRDLASLNVDFGNYYIDPTSYIGAFGASKDFTPTLMDRYSGNRKMDGTLLIDSTLWDKWSYIYDNVDPSAGKKVQRAVPLAADPFLGKPGTSTTKDYSTNPFYTFYCLDGAYDIKARIRMMVRDWDRVYSSNDKMEYISDIGLLTSARQDVLWQEEMPDDGSGLNWYNDRSDWDDKVVMDRTPGNYSSTGTVWRPAPVNVNDGLGTIWPFADGFFNPWIFPQVYTVD